jgi:hypothetical protein
MKTLYELVPNCDTGHEVSCTKPHREIDTGIRERVVTHPRLEVWNGSLRMRGYFACDLQRRLFHLLKIAGIIYSDVNRYCKFVFGQTEIRNNATSEFRIRDHYYGVSEHSQVSTAPTNFSYITLLAAFQPDKMTRFDWLLSNHVNAGKQVARVSCKARATAKVPIPNEATSGVIGIPTLSKNTKAPRPMITPRTPP